MRFIGIAFFTVVCLGYAAQNYVLTQERTPPQLKPLQSYFTHFGLATTDQDLLAFHFFMCAFMALASLFLYTTMGKGFAFISFLAFEVATILAIGATVQTGEVQTVDQVTSLVSQNLGFLVMVGAFLVL